MSEKKTTVRILNDIEAESADVLICMRVADSPHPPIHPHSQTPCIECGEMVYFSLQSPVSPSRMCAPCAMVKMAEIKKNNEDLTIATSQEMLEEALGLPPKPRIAH